MCFLHIHSIKHRIRFYVLIMFSDQTKTNTRQPAYLSYRQASFFKFNYAFISLFKIQYLELTYGSAFCIFVDNSLCLLIRHPYNGVIFDFQTSVIRGFVIEFLKYILWDNFKNKFSIYQIRIIKKSLSYLLSTQRTVPCVLASR